eukprot:473562_1
MTVNETEKYLSYLSEKDEKEIAKEIECVVASNANININNIAKSIKSLFKAKNALEQYRLTYEVQLVFKSIIPINIDLDRDFVDKYSNLLTRDIGSSKISEIGTLYEIYKNDLPNFKINTLKDEDEDDEKIRNKLREAIKIRNKLREAIKTKLKYLKLLANNRNIIKELYEQLGDNKRFDERMKLFSIDSTVDRERSMALRNVRKKIVDFVKEQINSYKLNTSGLMRAIAKIEVQDIDVIYLNTVTASWKQMLHNVSDPAASQFKYNNQRLRRLFAFAFADEKTSRHLFDRQDTTNYVKVIIGHQEVENKQHTEAKDEGKYDDEKDEQKDIGKQQHSNVEILSQNIFSSLIDGILIFMTGSDGIPPDIPQKDLKSYNQQDVAQLLKSKIRQLARLDINIYNAIEDNVGKKSIDGMRMIEIVESTRGNVNAIIDSIFSQKVKNEVDEEQLKNIAEEIKRTIQFILLQTKITETIVPKFELIKEIAKIRMNYHFEGGIEFLNENRRIQQEKTKEQLQEMKILWETRLNDWKKQVQNLRTKYDILRFYTVEELRYLHDLIINYSEKRNETNLTNLTAKLSFININITNEEVEKKLLSAEILEKQLAHINMNELGEMLQTLFGDQIYECIEMKIGKSLTLFGKKPHLFYCKNQSFVLHHLIKLFLSQAQRPTANKILFCDKFTSIEEIHCLFLRCTLSKTKQLRKQNPPLFCVVQPELLRVDIQDKFLELLQKYVYKSSAIFTIITTDRENRVSQKLSAFECFNLSAFTTHDKNEFFEQILCKNDKEFIDKTNTTKPLCKLILSQNECVGKTYYIIQIAKNKNYALVHVPINTKVADVDFIVGTMSKKNDEKQRKIAFHINVSSDAGNDVNNILFQLLVLRYLKTHSTVAFAPKSNHAFLIELPSKLSSLNVSTIADVQNHFYFITHSSGIIKHEIQDPLREYYSPLWTKNEVIINTLHTTEQDEFVYKYLDALEKNLLKNAPPDWDNNFTEPDWNYKLHENISDERKSELIKKYCHAASESLVFLKSFLQYMYQQLLLLSASHYSKNERSECYTVNDEEKSPPYHRLIAESLTKSGEQIACHMYSIADVDEKKEFKEYTEDEEKYDLRENLDEAKGIEDFFLVKYWATADPPLCLLNQFPLKSVPQITRDFFDTTNEEVLKRVCNQFEDIGYDPNNATIQTMINAIITFTQKDSRNDNLVWLSYQQAMSDENNNIFDEQKITAEVDADLNVVSSMAERFGTSFSLLSYRLSDNESLDAREWQFINKALKQNYGQELDVYNFADDKNDRDKAMSNNQYGEDETKQRKKLELLMKLCGGFKSHLPNEQKREIETLYNKHKGYALTFDNLLKIVAIFLRVKSC